MHLGVGISHFSNQYVCEQDQCDEAKSRKHDYIDPVIIVYFGDEIAKQEAAADRERLMIGLIQLTEKIINKVDAKISEKIVLEKDLVNEIFKVFLQAMEHHKENINMQIKQKM